MHEDRTLRIRFDEPAADRHLTDLPGGSALHQMLTGVLLRSVRNTPPPHLGLDRPLTPTQELTLEVLAARYRLGEQWWTFHHMHRPALRALAAAGLVQMTDGPGSAPVRAWLTDEGVTAYVHPDYRTPADRIREQVTVKQAELNRLWTMLRVEQQTNRALAPHMGGV